MKRGPNDTAPMGCAADPDRTDPGAPPSAATERETTDPGAWSPDVTPTMQPASSPEHSTDPGLDPMLEAFNRPPRPPAPQPNQSSSSDGDQFVAHYASPRELRSPQVRPTAHDPAVLVELARLARSDTSPLAGPTTDSALALQRGLETAMVRRKPAVPRRFLLISVGVGALAAAIGASFLGAPNRATRVVAPPATTESAKVVAPSHVPTTELGPPHGSSALPPSDAGLAGLLADIFWSWLSMPRRDPKMPDSCDSS